MINSSMSPSVVSALLEVSSMVEGADGALWCINSNGVRTARYDIDTAQIVASVETKLLITDSLKRN